MEPVTLFHIWPSLCSQKVRLALEEKGVPWRSRIVNIGPPMENYEPWYVRMNPRAVVPTLLIGDEAVGDSLNILRTIDARFDGPPLMPDAPEARAEAEALLERMDALHIRTLSYAPQRKRLRSLLHGAVGLRVRRLEKLKRQNPDLAEAYDAKLRDVRDWRKQILRPEAAEAARAEVLAVLEALEDRLDGRGPFLFGARYNLVDVMATTLVARVHMLKRTALLEPLPQLRAWYARVRERPTFTSASISEGVDKKKMAAILLPWALPRVAAAALVVGALTWAVVAALG